MTGYKRLLSLALLALLLSVIFPFITEPSSVEAADAWTAMTSGTTETLSGVWGSSGSNVFAVGADGTILHYNGSIWSAMTSGTTETLAAVWGSSATNVFAVGWSGTILHFNGTSWSTMSSGSGVDLYGIWGNSASSVFAVGGTQTILHWDGSTWTAMITPAEESPLMSVWGTSYSNVYAVGYNGAILHFDGSTWTAMLSGTTLDLYAIWGGSPTDIWAVGAATAHLHYNGSEWSSDGFPLMVTYRGLWGTSANDIFMACHNILGHSGLIKHYGGSEWDTMTTPACGPLYGIWGNCNTDIFTVGHSGIILHYGGGCGSPCSTSASVYTALGTVKLNAGNGCISNSAWLPPGNVGCSSPGGYTFTNGMLFFEVNGIPAGQTAKITIRFPTPLPYSTKYYICDGGSLINVGTQVTRSNEYTLVLSLTSGGAYRFGAAFPISRPQSSSPYIPDPTKAAVSLSNITVQSASLSATRVSPGTPVHVTASLANTGTGNGTSVVKVYVNGQEDDRQSISVNSGGASTVSFTVSRNEPGTYPVYVGGTQAGSFTVEDYTPDTILYISGALVFFAMVIGVIVMIRRRAG